jgi:hypothetical protein
MKKLTLLSSSILAAVAVSAVFTASAAANGSSSTVGDLVCNQLPTSAVCAALGVSDWGGMTPQAPGNEGSSSAGGYHCNNVLYLGPPENTGARKGTAYYTVGDPRVQLDPNGPHTGEGDCTLGDNADDPDLGPNCVPSVAPGCSIVLARGVGYANSNVLDVNVPSCDPPVDPDRNPGCPGRIDDGNSAGYVGVGRGNEVGGVNIDAGAQGTLP